MIISNDRLTCVNNNYYKCLSCPSKMNCPFYRPIYANYSNTSAKNIVALQEKIVFLEKENIELKQQNQYLTQENTNSIEAMTNLQDINNQLKEKLAILKSCGGEDKDNCKKNQDLQVINNSEIVPLRQDEGTTLVAKRGLFGVKYVEDKPKQKK